MLESARASPSGRAEPPTAERGHHVLANVHSNIGHMLWDVVFPSFHVWARLLGEA